MKKFDPYKKEKGNWIKRLLKWIYDNPYWTFAAITIISCAVVFICFSINNSIKNKFSIVEASDEKPFELVSDPQKIGPYRMQIIKDKETGVEYIIGYCRGENAITITPRLKGDNNEQYTE